MGFVFAGVALLAGDSDASMQRRFLVRHGTPNLVLLRVYDGRAICAQVDLDARTVGPHFTILPLDGDPPLSFKLEEVGPLAPIKVGASTQPTTTPATPAGLSPR